MHFLSSFHTRFSRFTLYFSLLAFSCTTKNITTQHKIIPPRQPFCPYNLRPRQNSFKHRATQRLVAQHVFEEKHTAFHIYHPITGKKQSLDTLLKSDDRAHYSCYLQNCVLQCNEILYKYIISLVQKDALNV